MLIGEHIKKEPFLKFLEYGVPYVFPVAPMELTRGMPTAWAAPILRGYLSAENQPVPVWPDSKGTAQGVAVKPLYRNVPQVSRENPKLYKLFALVDALRIGRSRERSLAKEQLSKLIE